MVEVVIVRDPDEDLDVAVFVNGVRVEAVVVDLDIGRGYTREEWRQGVEDRAAGLSPAAAVHCRGEADAIEEYGDFFD